MPYIKQEDRIELDVHIDMLAGKILDLVTRDGHAASFAGYLNYAITRLIQKVLPMKRYWTLALVEGVLSHIRHEFNRRVTDEYEDGKREENGDAYYIQRED